MSDPADSNRLAFAIASFIFGGGMIATVVAFTVVPLSELMTWTITILLPVSAILIGTGLVTKSTWDMLSQGVKKGKLDEQIKHWTSVLEKNPEATVDNTMYS